jgi:hypothetical protein
MALSLAAGNGREAGFACGLSKANYRASARRHPMLDARLKPWANDVRRPIVSHPRGEYHRS